MTDALDSIKSQAPTAKFVGEFAVKFVAGEIGKRISRATNGPTPSAPSEAPSSPTVPAERSAMSPGDSILEIPDYDIMGSRELVARLRTVSRETVVLVQQQESSGRNRATVLSACVAILNGND